MKHLTSEEIQQITFDWRYRGFTTLELLTEEECDEINAELDKFILQWNENAHAFKWNEKTKVKIEKFISKIESRLNELKLAS